MTRKFEEIAIPAEVTRQREATRMRKRLDEVSAALRALGGCWGLWADTVRQTVEMQHDVAYPVAIEEADKVLLDDPVYVAALGLGRAIDQARSTVQRVLDSFNELAHKQ
jgi:hypothetical protein